MDNTLFQQARQGDVRSIARCISLIEHHQAAEKITDQKTGSSVPVIGVTGPPGAGKSTLIDALIGEYVSEGKQIAVLCVDPSSPFHSGALLGDRIRMNRWYQNPAVFIRSLSSGGALGGIHPLTTDIVRFVSTCGFDLILIETVGVGQSEVEVVLLATVTLLVLVPEAGDEIQFMKSGLMEAADLFVVNKSDRPGAERFAGRLRSVLHGMPRQFLLDDPIVSVIAAEGKGITALKEKISAFITNKKK
jgi:LAO/AO transport system kinase